ncbi:hypothetical protein EV207_12252 [Scopulibacillus darangshiensis]|uniref:Uncharacterized protein n=1 Tax=Scopulibacillus darangshiensis TaxID=442528 RepID=A0A4R2NSL0_9BACL|nr:hypothetical protein [Scopulibacillus darangshiensis]TCP24949.1 hypothetical protein EV207_12252 [Scopulibacillus darangshiensis]
MGCCDPNFRKDVEQQEEHVNQHQRESVPLAVKSIIVAVVAAVIGLLIYMS